MRFGELFQQWSEGIIYIVTAGKLEYNNLYVVNNHGSVGITQVWLAVVDYCIAHLQGEPELCILNEKDSERKMYCEL